MKTLINKKPTGVDGLARGAATGSWVRGGVERPARGRSRGNLTQYGVSHSDENSDQGVWFEAAAGRCWALCSLMCLRYGYGVRTQGRDPDLFLGF